MSLNPRISNWNGLRVWLIGASTGIGRATAHALHARGAIVIVSARNAQSLEDFTASHQGAQALALDVTRAADVKEAANMLLAQGPLDLVCYCAGYYRAMRATDIDLPDMLMHHEVNTLGALYTLEALTQSMLVRKRGHISLVSSVAGYGGLPLSLAYGPTKAALINLAETLYLDLRDHGIGVSVINPGFVETPLTANNEFHMPALISPQTAAQEIVRGWERGEFEIHFPKRFSRIIKLLSWLPYPLYFPLIKRFTKV